VTASKNLLRVKAPAKINLHLEVLGLRPDGFHELAMVMQSIDLADYLEITSNTDGFIRLTVDDPDLSAGDDNLIIKAARLLRSKAGIDSLGANIHLEKNIPIGAGLAGGSSDGAAALLGLSSFWRLPFSNQQLMDFAAELGSDMPFCLKGGSQLCFGRGEKLEPLSASNVSMAAILVKDPLASVSTPWAYGLCKEIKGSSYLKSENDFELRRQELKGGKWLKPLSALNPPPLKNDLQELVAKKTPAVQNALNLLSQLPGTIGIAMSGSGPSCFALFPSYSLAEKHFEQNRRRLIESGLDSWCCSFRSEGVTLEP